MQIVIDIDEERYKDIQRIAEVQMQRRMPTVEQIIANGAPLPKGHGRLIDADELFDKIQFADFSSSDDVNTALFSIGDAPTIIEADKVGEEG